MRRRAGRGWRRPVSSISFDSLAAGAAASVNSLVSVLNTANTAFLTQTNAFIGSPPNPTPNQVGGGVWARGIGGRVDTDSTGVVTVAPNPIFGAGGTITCNTTTRTDFAGYQAGVDLARLNVGGTNLHFGATAGYVEANAKDITTGVAASRGNFQIPFAGVYAALTYGGFFVDAQVRADFYEMSLADPSNGVFNQNLNARGTTVSSNVGYYHPLANSWFIEPSAGIVWSRVNVDPLNISGTLVLGSGLAPPSRINIGDVESILGRASIRLGTNFTTGNVALQPFVTASLLHEFGADVISTSSTSFGAVNLGAIPDVTSTLNSSRVGTYGQFAVGIAGQVIDTGWLGYARVDFRTGENIEGISVNGGIRYQFTPEQIAAVAGGGKGPVYKAPPAVVPVAYNWTGFYVGGYVGTTWGSTNWTFVVPPAFTRTSPDFDGFVGGGQIGFNYQIGSTVIGFEADIGGSNAKGALACPNAFFFTCESHMDWLSTITGRIGYTWGRTLFYAKGGFAAARMTEQTVWNPDGAPVIVALTGTPPTPTTQASTATPTGFTIGAGFEFGLTPNWSAKAEYLYYDLGNTNYTFTADTFTNVAKVHETGNLVRLGLNYRFTSLGLPLGN